LCPSRKNALTVPSDISNVAIEKFLQLLLKFTVLDFAKVDVVNPINRIPIVNSLFIKNSLKNLILDSSLNSDRRIIGSDFLEFLE
jgi:hypothetical protein